MIKLSIARSIIIITNLFGEDSVIAVQRIDASYPKKYFLYLDFFERYNYHSLVYLRQFVKTTLLLQKQPSRGVLKKRCSEVMQQIYSNFIEITLRHGCSPVNLWHIFRTPFSKNSSGWLLLSLTTLTLNKIKKAILSRRVTIVLSGLWYPLNLLVSANRLEL